MRAVLDPLLPGPGWLTSPSWSRVGGRMAPSENLLWVADDGAVVVAPVGFAFNGASIPRALWWLGHPFEPWVLRSACIHDLLCDQRDPRGSAWVHEQFRLGLLLDACTRWERTKARTYAIAVRAFGPRWPASEIVSD